MIDDRRKSTHFIILLSLHVCRQKFIFFLFLLSVIENEIKAPSGRGLRGKTLVVVMRFTLIHMVPTDTKADGVKMGMM